VFLAGMKKAAAGPPWMIAGKAVSTLRGEES
jgi:hypothetical protein